MPNKKEINATSKSTRAPIVTIMGHVDHGKTSILDAIRKTDVQAHEFGGITQHIGAYQIFHKGNPITFIDTPGHAAFTQMRARGGRAADIVVLVVAADDGVQPQTQEAISHARAAGVPMIVAINKIDSVGADVNKTKQMLAQENVLVEDWGGDIIAVETSALKGIGLDKLLDSILALAEVQNINGDVNQELEAMVIEAKKDSKKGVVVSAIIRNGVLKIGDEVSASGFNAKVKSIMNDKGELLKQALPSMPVEILGFSEVPHVGDLIVEKGSELAALSIDESRVEIVGRNTKRTVGIIIRADTQGTLEAVKASLAKLVTENVNAEFSLKFLLESTGSPTDSDVLLAASAKGIIVGFNVKIPANVEELSKEKKVPVKNYKTIYELIDEVKDVLEGAAFDEEAKIKGRAKVNKIFKLPSGDIIAGCIVLAGALKDTSRVSIYAKDPSDLSKADVAVYNGEIKKLKRQKDEVSIVGKDNECGVLLKPQFDGIAEGMFIEVR